MDETTLAYVADLLSRTGFDRASVQVQGLLDAMHPAVVINPPAPAPIVMPPPAADVATLKYLSALFERTGGYERAVAVIKNHLATAIASEPAPAPEPTPEPPAEQPESTDAQ